MSNFTNDRISIKEMTQKIVNSIEIPGTKYGYIYHRMVNKELTKFKNKENIIHLDTEGQCVYQYCYEHYCLDPDFFHNITLWKFYIMHTKKNQYSVLAIRDDELNADKLPIYCGYISMVERE